MLPILSLAALALLFSLWGGRRIERALPMSVLFHMLVFSALAALGLLAAADGVFVSVLALCVLLGGAALRKGKGKALPSLLFTPGLLCFAAFAGLLWLACKPMVVWWSDDVRYWALTPKALWYINGLLDSRGSLAASFGNYTPGMPALSWLALRAAGQWEERLLYFTLYLTYGVFLLPLFTNVTWRQAWKLPFALLSLFALPMLSNLLSFTFLGVDTVLAACLAFTLLLLEDGEPDAPALALGLCGLVLLKLSGALLCLIPLSYWLFCRRKKNLASVKLWAAWASPFALYGLWMLFCGLNGLSGRHMQRLLQFVSGDWAALLSAFGYALCHLPTTENLLTALPLLPAPKLAVLALLCLCPLFLRRDRGVRAMCWATDVTVFYLLAILVSFRSVFAGELATYTGENVNNMSLLLERYLAPLTLGLAALNLYWLRQALPRYTPRNKALALAALTFVFGLCVGWQNMADKLLPSRYLNYDGVLSLSVADTTEANALWADDFDSRRDELVLIDFSYDQEYMENLNYTFAPARFLKVKDDLSDASALQALLMQNRVTLVLCLDDACGLYAGLSQLYDAPETDTLYRVEADGSVGEYAP